MYIAPFEQLIQLLYIYFLKDKEELESAAGWSACWRAAAGVQKKEEKKNKNNFLLLY